MSTSSCVTTDQRIIAAAEAKGKVDAGVKLADLPADCSKLEAHAGLQAGDEIRSVLVKERGALDRANGRVTRCSAFYNDQKSKLEAQ